MKSYSQALKILKKNKIKFDIEKINSLKSLNRISAVNIYSKTHYPASNNSAFDGFAINSKETRNLNTKRIRLFKILGSVAAGSKPKSKKIKKFETYEIMTGGILPKGFDAVIPKEQVVLYPNKKNAKFISINQKIIKNKNIRFKGSDYKKNELLIKKGTILKSNHILALKTLGIKYIRVKKIPNILFFSTGNEISNKDKIQNWKVRNSNLHYIKSASQNFLYNFHNGGILRDKDEYKFEKKIKNFIKSKNDIIITSGAVSAGKFDFVPDIIKKFRLSAYFKSIAIRPGKPVLFAKIKGKQKVIFGLPGNPISSVACLRFFVYPYLEESLEVEKEKSFKAVLKNNYSKNANFTIFLRSRINTTKNGKLEVEIFNNQESFRIKPFVKSNVWTVLPSGKAVFKKNEIVDCFFPNQPNKIF